MRLNRSGFYPGICKINAAAGFLTTLLWLATAFVGRADDGSNSMSSMSCPVTGYFENWFTRVSQIQSEQPRFVTPLSTVTPRLEEELRYDQYWEALPGGHELDNYGGGGGKGVELIPFDPVEVIIGIPSWQTRNTSPPKNGWTDESFLVKYRILSANETNGNYILTAFMGLTVPDGSANTTSHHWTYTPTIAYGQGWGDFDFQSTLGISVPNVTGDRAGPGMPIAWNTAFQYRLQKYFWPEVEANYTYYPNGEHEGLNQLFITPGLLIGRIPIYDRVGLTFGAGVQVAVTDHALYHKNVILTARLPF